MKPKNNSVSVRRESFGCKVKMDGMSTEEVLQSNRWNWGRCEAHTASLDRWIFIKKLGYHHADPIFRQVRLVCECVLLLFVLNEVLCCLWLLFCKVAIIVPSWNSRCPWQWWPAEAAWIIEVLESDQWASSTCLALPDIYVLQFWLRDRCYASMQISFTCSPPPIFTESERLTHLKGIVYPKNEHHLLNFMLLQIYMTCLLQNR